MKPAPPSSPDPMPARTTTDPSNVILAAAQGELRPPRRQPERPQALDHPAPHRKTHNTWPSSSPNGQTIKRIHKCKDNEQLAAGLRPFECKVRLRFWLWKRTGVPCLKLWKIKKRKVYCVLWSEGTLTCYDHFNLKQAVGKRLDDELFILWSQR